jgi:acetyl-CoA acetyltransferase
MGIGPVFAVPETPSAPASKSTTSACRTHEAFAVQVLYCMDTLGIPPDRINVNGGAIMISHPYGVSGARLVGHARANAADVKYAVVTMCVGGGRRRRTVRNRLSQDHADHRKSSQPCRAGSVAKSRGDWLTAIDQQRINGRRGHR